MQTEQEHMLHILLLYMNFDLTLLYHVFIVVDEFQTVLFYHAFIYLFQQGRLPSCWDVLNSNQKILFNKQKKLDRQKTYFPTLINTMSMLLFMTPY